MIENKFEPDIALHPGKTLEEILDNESMSQIDLAKRTGLTSKTINEIVQGKSPITTETALKLSTIFGMSSAFWNNLQKDYEETLTRLKSEAELIEEMPLLKKYTCYKELETMGFVVPEKDPIKKISNLCKFFSVSSLKLVSMNYGVAFRKADKSNLSKESLAAWLRCGELLAQKIDAKKFDKDKLLASINQLRNLTNETPIYLKNKLEDICASFGVAVVFVPYLKNTYVNGATRWIHSDKALIQLKVSLTGNYIDTFWFTFFHEIGHLLKHGRKDQFVEFEQEQREIIEEKEKEADEFASNILIPASEYKGFKAQNHFSHLSIKTFAKKLNIHPSIVAGRLARDQNDWRRFSTLRKRFSIILKA